MAAHGVPTLLLPSMSPQALGVYVFFFLLLVLAYSARSSPASRNKLLLPPSPPRLPVIGHLHLLGTNPHLSLAALSRNHGGGGLMLLHLGQVPTLVVSTPRAAEAVARTHDHVFASRPHSVVADILLGGASDVALAPYGEYWRQARKIVTAHLLSTAKVRALRAAREEEASLALARVQDAAAARAAIDMTDLLSTYTNDVMCRAVSGRKKASRNEVFKEVIAGNAAALGGFNSLDDYFPSLAKVGLLRRVVTAKTSRLKKRWDHLLDDIIDEHHHAAEHGDRQQQHNNFVDILLSLQHDYNLTRENVRVILMDMFAAGTDTSYIVLEFAMAELMRKPHAMAKLQAEVRKKTTTTLREEDLSGMAYLQAVIKETLRLHPPAPLLLPRLSMADCDVDGYTIPAGTRVIINAWALGRDPESWGDDAEEFIPERFMDGGDRDRDLRGRDFQFLPFGAGRRICPGMSFGLATVELMLAKLVHGFDWELPEGMREEDVDMTDVFGLTVRRKEKLLLVPIETASMLSSTIVMYGPGYELL